MPAFMGGARRAQHVFGFIGFRVLGFRVWGLGSRV